MQSRIAALLTVLSGAITLLVAMLLTIGAGPALVMSGAVAIALIGWLLFSFQPASANTSVLSPFLLELGLLLALETSRYFHGVPAAAFARWRAGFVPSFELTDVHWFVFFVVCPIALLLLGGHFLARRTPLGYFFAWLGFVYAIAQALLQFDLGYSAPLAMAGRWTSGLLAAGVMATGIVGIARLASMRGAAVDARSSVGQLTRRQTNLWTALFVALVVVYGASLYSQAGLLPVGVIVASMMGGLIGWRKTTSRVPADPEKVVPLYLLLLAFFYFHVGEESLTGFNRGIAQITGTTWPDREFTLLIGLIGPAVWVGGALSLWLRQPFGNFLLWFMIVGMIVGEPTHFLVFPFARMHQTGAGYEYFSGMYTSLFPMIPAVLALVTIVRDARERAPT